MNPIPLTACRACGSKELFPVLNLGIQSLTGTFPKNEIEERRLTRGPLRLVRCDNPECELVQLDQTYSAGEMYGSNYGYRSGLNQSMVRHLSETAEWLKSRMWLRPGSRMLDIGANDGTFLNFFPGIRRVGMDPTCSNFVDFFPKGVDMLPMFFSAANFRRAINRKPLKLITSIACFYDLPDPQKFVDDVASLLCSNGYWFFEQAYLGEFTFDAVCHEHLEYYSLKPIRRMLAKAGMKIRELRFNDVNGGSVGILASKHGTEAAGLDNFVLNEASRFGFDFGGWYKINEQVERNRGELLRLLYQYKRAGKKVVALGASTKGNVLLQYYGLSPDLIECVGEVNPTKFRCLTPGTCIPICPQETALKGADAALILPWHFRAGFEEKLAGSGVERIYPLPHVEVVKT